MEPVYFCFLVPIIAICILYFFFRKHIVWWELIVPMLACILFIVIAKVICIHSLTTDTEYLGGYVQETRYYEPWNEYIHRTCTSCSGSGKTRSCHSYDCSYVKYHHEYWTAETTLGTFNISEEKYNKLLKKFDATITFYDMHRHYHTIDGDMYYGKWKGENERLESVTKTHDYENRPQAAVNVFHFDKVDTADIKTYGLYEYPKIYDYFNQQNILGYNDQKAEHKLQVLNARLGNRKQARVYILLFRDKDRDAGHLQEMYWAGANKNEFIVCIGIDNRERVKWAYDFSWTEREDVKVDLRTFIESQGILDLPSIIDYTYSEIENKWERKDFHDFDYLTIEPTFTQTIWIFVLTIAVAIGCCWWTVTNEFDNEEEFFKKGKRNFRY